MRQSKQRNSQQKTWLDNVIAYVSPEMGARRLAYRELYNNYEGGVPTRTDHNWTNSRTIGQSAKEVSDIQGLIMRSRDVEKNSDIGKGLLKRYTDNAIGNGFKLQAKTGDKEFDRESEERFAEFMNNADIRGMFGGVKLQHLLMNTRNVDGQCGILLTKDGNKPKLQIFDGLQLKTPRGKSQNNIVSGVEVNGANKPIAFHVRTKAGVGREKITRILARDYIHYARINQANSLIGTPLLSQVLGRLSQIDNYAEAVILAARMGAVFGLIFKEKSPGTSMLGLGMAQNSAGQQQKALTLENGMAKYIGHEDDVVQVNPQQPMQQTPEFIAAMLRLIGLPLSMPLEIVMLDFSKVNFSSYKAAFLQFYRSLGPEQEEFKLVLGRIYQWWISSEVKAGRFTNKAPDRFWAHEFIADGWQSVDRVREAQADLLEITMGVNNTRRAAASRGLDIDDILAGVKADEAMRIAAGLPNIMSPFTMQPNNQLQEVNTNGQ